jgi:hypothetical protein
MAVEDFLGALDLHDELYKTTDHYGCTIAIVQLSGTGKSKLMYDLADKVDSDDAKLGRPWLIAQFIATMHHYLLPQR